MAAKYPPIAEPTTDVVNLRDSVLSLKQGFEILTGQRGNGTNAAVTKSALAATSSVVGSYVEFVLASAGAVALVSGTAKTIIGFQLPAGDWDVDGLFQSVPANTTVVSQFASSYSLVANTLDITAGRVVSPPMPPVTYNGTVGVHILLPPCRFNLSVPTPLYLTGFAIFTTSTCSAFGLVRARRFG
jgi:hypothetical protein